MGLPVITSDYRVGHIVGFKYNIQPEAVKALGFEECYHSGRVVVNVAWADGETHGIHPGNISRL